MLNISQGKNFYWSCQYNKESLARMSFAASHGSTVIATGTANKTLTANVEDLSI